MHPPLHQAGLTHAPRTTHMPHMSSRLQIEKSRQLPLETSPPVQHSINCQLPSSRVTHPHPHTHIHPIESQPFPPSDLEYILFILHPQSHSLAETLGTTSSRYVVNINPFIDYNKIANNRAPIFRSGHSLPLSSR